MSLNTTEALFRKEMTLRNNSEPEAAFKEWLMVTRPPAVVHRVLFYISKLEVLKKAYFFTNLKMKALNYYTAFVVML